MDSTARDLGGGHSGAREFGASFVDVVDHQVERRRHRLEGERVDRATNHQGGAAAELQGLLADPGK